MQDHHIHGDIMPLQAHRYDHASLEFLPDRTLRHGRPEAERRIARTLLPEAHLMIVGDVCSRVTNDRLVLHVEIVATYAAFHSVHRPRALLRFRLFYSSFNCASTHVVGQYCPGLAH